MTSVFLLICGAGVTFFVFFLVGSTLSERQHRYKSTRRSAVRGLPEAQALAVFGGRRFFVYLEEQMSEFLAEQGPKAVMVLLVLLVWPVIVHAQGPSASPETDVTDGQQIPPAVARQLEAMQKRIEQLEQQLQQKSSSPPMGSDGMTQHALLDQGSAAYVPSVQTKEAGPIAPATTATEKPAPFSFADFTWLTGNPRIKEVPFDTKFFTPEIRVDVNYTHSFNHPKDDTIGGSSEIFRSNEFQLTQLGVGGDFHWDNVQARLMTQFGLYSQTQPRNDPSAGRGQWNLDGAYQYLAEAYGGYHFNVLDGVNVQAGIFMSYIGLYSFYNFDNWSYQPSYVSSNTPWFFNGMRAQIFLNEHLKIEPWIINGWQSYGRFNHRPGVGGQILWRPNGWLSIVGNQYVLGADTLNNPGRIRYHTDDSIQVKYYDHPDRTLDKMAFTFTGDMGCEHGGGVSCTGDSKQGPKQSFLGYMIYNRFWFHKDLYAVTVGGGQINNPGRYLVLLPPINGATALSGTQYFTENPGDPFKAWDASGTFDYMPSQYLTFRWEYNHRHANVPYFSGPGGITPQGGNTGAPGSMVDGFTPDLRKTENRVTGAMMVMF